MKNMNKKNLTTASKINKMETINLPVIDENQGRVFVYIDGSNLFHRIKKLSIREESFQYKKFIKWLVGKPAQTTRYYVGMIRWKEDCEKTQVLYKTQQQRFERLKKDDFYIVRGKMIPKGSTFVEKGVDVKIATDLVVGALGDMYDEVYLLSSDGDLAPAVDYITSKTDKRIHYIAFEESYYSRDLLEKATSMRMIKKDELLQFGEEFLAVPLKTLDESVKNNIS